jgi:UDP-2,3-diacylglucosamine pyrophosphatase LpxH
MLHTVAISDIHLCEIEPGDGLWMRYRQAPYSPDTEIAAMLDALRAQMKGTSSADPRPALKRPARSHADASRDELTLVLNGDVFDFDAPRVIGQKSVFHDLPRSAEHAIPAIEAILADHTVFVEALGRVLADGHTVVFVSGNHDVQLTLPEVRAVVQARVVAAAVAVLEAEGAAASSGEARAALASQVVFRAWFHRTPDGIIVEHGNQYDAYCSYRYPMAPFGRKPGEIQPTMGSLACRLLVSRMGYFNPHVDTSFMLSAFGYFTHWARYYLFSRHSLAMAWALGAMRTVVELVRRRDPERRVRRRESLAAAARETGAPLRAVARHARLFARPAEDRLGRVARELWLDRAVLLLLAVTAALVWLLLVPGWLAPAALLGPAALLAYERVVPKPPLDATWKSVSRAARHVARAHRARAVVFGHTHSPEGAWEGGVFFGNTGSWSAAFEDIACTRPVFAERPLVWLRSEGPVGAEPRLTGGLVTWTNGRFEARAASLPPPTGQRNEAAGPSRPPLRPQAAAALRG